MEERHHEVWAFARACERLITANISDNEITANERALILHYVSELAQKFESARKGRNPYPEA
jgi:hypothetical protein